MKHYHSATNLLTKKSMNPLKTKGLILVLVLGIGSTAVLAGCNSTKSATDSPDTSTPTTSTKSSDTSSSSATSTKSSDTPSSPATSTKSSDTSSPTKNSDVKKAEDALKSLYSKQAGVPIESVKCPESTSFKVGSTFECQAKAQGVNFGIQVKMENDKGNFDSSTKGLLILTKIEDLLKKTVKEKANIDVTADCGGKLRAAKTGDSFTCQVKDTKGQSKEATVTVKDDQGNINVKL